MSVNKVILVGNVGKDPETRYLEGGTAVSKFPLATSEVYRNREGEKITNTEWHNIVLWRAMAEVAEKYVKKGTQLYIEGRIKTRSYTDKEGNTRYITEITGDNMQMLGKRSDNRSDNSSDNSSDSSSGSSQYQGNDNNDKQQNEPDTKGSGNNDDVYGNLGSESDETDDLPF